jgi:hypothetical protein
MTMRSRLNVPPTGYSLTVDSFRRKKARQSSANKLALGCLQRPGRDHINARSYCSRVPSAAGTGLPHDGPPVASLTGPGPSSLSYRRACETTSLSVVNPTPTLRRRRVRAVLVVLRITPAVAMRQAAYDLDCGCSTRGRTHDLPVDRKGRGCRNAQQQRSK